MRMPNGDLQIDFRDPDVADTVRSKFAGPRIMFADRLLGLSRARKSVYRRCWQCTTFLDCW